jgi:hypothetical protein
MFLQTGYGHGHLVRQGSLLGARELSQAEQAAHAITGLLKLSFEPSMLWTADSIGRGGAHRAPVENVEEQCSRKANKRQTLFSPIVRSPAGLAFRVSTRRSQGLLLWTNSCCSNFSMLAAGLLCRLGPMRAPQSALVGIAITPDLEIIFDLVKKSRKFANNCR